MYGLMIKRTLILLGLSMVLQACGDEEGVVNVNLKVAPLLNANLQPVSLPSNGTLKVTAFDVEQGGIRKQESKEFNLGAGTGKLGALDFGTWRFYIEAEGDNQKYYGVTAPFEITQDDQQVNVSAIVGKSNCVGLLPPQTQSKDFPGSIELIAPYAGIAGAELPDGRIVITGGGTIDQSTGRLQGISNEIQLYDPRYGMIMKLDRTLNTPRAYHEMTVLPNGDILVSGGVSSLPMGRYQPTNQIEIISLVDSAIEVRVSNTAMTEARYHHQALLLSDGTVLLAGGIGDPVGDATNYLRTAMRYFPNEDQMRAQGSMKEAKAYMSLSTLGRMSEVAVVMGGLTANGASDTIEIFSINPQQNCDRVGAAQDQGCFINFGDLKLAEARWGHSAMSLKRNSNSVLLAGGFAGGTPDTPSNVVGSVETLSLNITETQAEFEVKTFFNALSSNSRGLASTFQTYNDEMVMIGGFNGGSQNQVTRFSPVLDPTNQFVSVNILDEGMGDQCVLSEARYSPTVVATKDHGLLIFGGVKRGTLNGSVVHIVSKRVEMYYPTLPVVETLLQQ